MSAAPLRLRRATTIAHAGMGVYLIQEHVTLRSFRLRDALEGVDSPFSEAALVCMSMLCAAPIAITAAMGFDRWWAFLIAAILDSGFVRWHYHATVDHLAANEPAVHDAFFLVAFFALMSSAFYSAGSLVTKAFFRGQAIPRAQLSDGPKPRSRPR
jgi:hypothetical protein